ncbi:MAG TPA: type II CAAX endopeptidase family protein [Thermoanaerobaculia bacterium]|nr:type II CAAX endopeptidase family protein [Thermoanaerobaculia bacterium]
MSDTELPPPTVPRERFTAGDVRFLLLCLVVAAAAAIFTSRYFDHAFPEASIDFRYDRSTSRPLAEAFAQRLGLPIANRMHAAEFDHDDRAKVYLERTVGLERSKGLTRSGDVRLWFWTHRWFQPLDREEVRINVATTGQIIAFEHVIPEEKAVPALAPGDRELRQIGERFLSSVGVDPAGLSFASVSQKTLPHRVDTTLIWEKRLDVPAPYRYVVTLQGNQVGSFSQALRVPDEWLRDYADLRSKNEAASQVDTIFLVLTTLAALVIFVLRVRQGDLAVRFTVGTGIVCAILLTLVSLNSLPQALAHYDTQTSYSAFILKSIIFSVAGGVGAALFLMVIVGSGEALYRGRFPHFLAIPRLFRTEALQSKRLYKSFVLGLTLVAVFLAYQVAFYLIAARYGAWAPAEVPYDDILNTAVPWVAVLFIGFFPSFSEEFLSRAFSIPFLESLLRSRVFAVLLAAYIWGFGHSAYPNQPFFIRGVEVGTAGVLIGIILYRFGLVPLLVWHYTVDALYTALLLMKSHNSYYIFSSALSSFILVLPLVISTVLYFRRGGFIPDDPLTNAAAGSAGVGETKTEPPGEPLPPPMSVQPRRWVLAGVLLVSALCLNFASPPVLNDVIDYRMTRQEALMRATSHLQAIGTKPLRQYIVFPSAGFRDWVEGDEGGAPGQFDATAVDYVGRNTSKPLTLLLDTMRTKIRAATWKVRFFEPRVKNEKIVEIDPRSSEVVGFTEQIEEKAPGASLPQNIAEGIARRELSRYHLSSPAFTTKAAIALPQPRRRDWLFHFQETTPIVAEGFRWANVRIAGDRVVHFGQTVKIPEAFELEQGRTTLLNSVMLLASIAAALALLIGAVVGFVLALRDQPFRWRLPLRWAIFLGAPAILANLISLSMVAARYDTRIDWHTFQVQAAVGVFGTVLFQVLSSFLALLVICTTIPFAAEILSREGRRRFGLDAIAATIAAIALLMLLGETVRQMNELFPPLLSVGSIKVTEAVAIPAPALVAIWDSIFRALIGCAFVSSLAAMLERAAESKKMMLKIALVASIAFLLTDHSASGARLGGSFAVALISASAAYLIAMSVLRRNPLAYASTFFLAALLGKAHELLRNHRIDLQWNGGILLALSAGVLMWLAWPGLAPDVEAGNDVKEEALSS